MTYTLRFEECTGISQRKSDEEELSRRRTQRVQVSGKFGGEVQHSWHMGSEEENPGAGTGFPGPP